MGCGMCEGEGCEMGMRGEKVRDVRWGCGGVKVRGVRWGCGW